jgi:hypothetical protein
MWMMENKKNRKKMITGSGKLYLKGRVLNHTKQVENKIKPAQLNIDTRLNKPNRLIDLPDKNLYNPVK